MSIPVVRVSDTCSGHGCFGSRMAVVGSPNVFANGIPLHRVGDVWETHCCGPVCHSGVAATGSSTVFVNGVPVCRVGDAVDCGSTMIIGSPNVMAGG